MERFSFVFLIAGVGFFAFAFTVAAWLPMLPVRELDVRSLEQLAEIPPLEFEELRDQYPEAFAKAFGEETDLSAAFEQALETGHSIYRAEGCWHCHSQQVRPWGNDEARYGRRSFPEEYHNQLNMPPLWGTRRIGPDLIRRGGQQSNDWHVAHFYHPPDVTPLSVMPSYRWFYEEDGVTPNRKGLSIIAYVQWLGSWVQRTDETIGTIPVIERRFPAPEVERPQAPPQPEETTEEPGA